MGPGKREIKDECRDLVKERKGALWAKEIDEGGG